MPQSPEQVFKDLKKNQYSPIYFLQGEEPFYIDKIAAYIEQNALPEEQKGFNQVVMYGKDVDVNTVITNARRFPMMAERQVVIVREAQDMQDFNTQIAQQLLEKYITNPLPSTILVFCYKYKVVGKGLTQMLDKFAVLVTTKKLYDNQLPAWISQHVSAQGFRIDDKAVQMLADFVGNNLERLSNEIEKVLINFNEKEENPLIISPEIIQKYVGISKEYNVFELQKALGVLDVVKANLIVNYFEANPKANPLIPIIAALFTFYSKLLLVHSATDKTERGLAVLLKINPYFAKEYLIAARNFPLSKVVQNIHFLREADLRSKGVDSGGITDGQILKELVFKLMH